MRLFFKFADALLALAKLMTILIMAGMTISVLIGVFFRYVIPLPMAWPPEAARFMMVAVTMFASSIAIRQLEHVGITIIVDALPRALRTGLYLLGMALTAAFLVVFIAFSYRLTFEMGPRQISSSLGLSMVAAYVAMPLGGVMMLVQLVAATIEAMRRARAGQSPFVAGSGIS
ncbi:TRAP-type C4-dicarboxylate transport system, small permease component [Devosia enhydra]|uniref:TRAP transporter small permease protein n=1 Tax=Devosia enhydra TaxID=665118 RepID=A0A1K2HYN4_9HYPH|nr:TRAP transporter small permease [Devosia enhydra]SFZ85134.1 TRAP-type C4-dicarboxylate transport system, small permease component [Devosia enhydra]